MENKWWKKIAICLLIIVMTIVADKCVQIIIHKQFCKIVEDDFSCVFQVDSLKKKDGKLVLDGWVFKLEEDAGKEDFDIILYDYINGKKYYLEVEDKIRKDVNEYFLCEYNYTDSGFEAAINVEKLELEDVNYEVLVQCVDGINAYRTGTYITSDGIMYARPEEYVPLDVSGTGIEEIVHKGVLRVYRPDVGMYVYQYMGKLYWIAGESYEFEDDGSTLIEYQLNTTQVSKLPKHRIDKGYFWENAGFYYEMNEEKEIGNVAYRVVETSIPEDYSVTRIWTGYYKDGWVWRSDFRPWYEFE